MDGKHRAPVTVAQVLNIESNRSVYRTTAVGFNASTAADAVMLVTQAPSPCVTSTCWADLTATRSLDVAAPKDQCGTDSG